MIIQTSDTHLIKPFLDKLYIPPADSHKGHNGKVLIIGGSSLFHASPIWSAEIAAHIVDMVHFSSTKENNEIVFSLKKSFKNGIIIPQRDIPEYIQEDDAVLVGPGMVRSDGSRYELGVANFEEIVKIQDEAEFTYQLTHYLLKQYPEKKFVIDAGALQMMKPEWLKKFEIRNSKFKIILTPHQLEFERLFGIAVTDRSLDEKKRIVQETAARYHVVILLKAVTDIVSDGTDVITIEGGNPGLTKGGTGDVLAGLTLALYAKNDPVVSAVVASWVEKKAAEKLAETTGLWFNVDDLIKTIPTILADL